MSAQRITDTGPERRYFTMVPHLVTDLLTEGLISPVAFAMYVYFRRRCGEHGDEFVESLRNTAKHLGNKSVGTCFTARAELVDAQLVDLHLSGPEGHEQAHITIRDVWPENMAKYAVKPRHESLRSNIERKPRRTRTQKALSVQSLPDASVQILNAARPLTGEPEEPEKKEEPEEPEEPERVRAHGAAAPENSGGTLTESQPGVLTEDEALPMDLHQLAYRIQALADEFEDSAVAACISQAQKVFQSSGLEFYEFDNACKLAAHDTRQRRDDPTRPRLGTPMAYFFHALRTAAAERAAREAAVHA